MIWYLCKNLKNLHRKLLALINKYKPNAQKQIISLYSSYHQIEIKIITYIIATKKKYLEISPTKGALEFPIEKMKNNGELSLKQPT